MLVAMVGAAALAAPGQAPAPAPEPCRTRACVERVAARRCELGSVASCVHRGALRWRVSYATLMRKAGCETGWTFDPRAYNSSSGAAGLFQFERATWKTTPYRHRSIWRAKWSSLAAAWMHHVHRGGEWACR